MTNLMTDDSDLEPEMKKRVSRDAFTFSSLITRCWDRKGPSTPGNVPPTLSTQSTQHQVVVSYNKY